MNTLLCELTPAVSCVVLHRHCIQGHEPGAMYSNKKDNVWDGSVGFLFRWRSTVFRRPRALNEYFFGVARCRLRGHAALLSHCARGGQ